MVLVPNQNNGVKEAERCSDKARDVLDYNNYIVLAEEFKGLKRVKVESAFSYGSNQLLLDYVLGQHLVSELVPQLDLKIVAKIGPQHLVNLCRNTPNMIRLREPR